MFWIRWLRYEIRQRRTKHGPVWSNLHDRVICLCGEGQPCRSRTGRVKDYEKIDGRWKRVW